MRSYFVVYAAVLLAACGIEESSGEIDAIDVAQISRLPPGATRVMPLLPSIGGSGPLSPWGGSDISRHRSEAMIANAASAALNDAWSYADVEDAIAAVPVRMISSGFRQFGDGQANAEASFEWWREKRPPVVATLVKFRSGESRVYFRFDRALPIQRGDFEVRGTYDGVWAPAQSFTAVRDANGDWVGEFIPSVTTSFTGALYDGVNLVHPVGWRDWFPIHFRQPVRSTDELVTTVPSSMRNLSDGTAIVDPLQVSIADEPTASETPLDRLWRTSFPFGWSSSPYMPNDIHGQLPSSGRTITTAVGRGWTWVSDRPSAPFKLMYTCFERRRADLEASAADGGVVSGSGWHEIGDPAETILHALEKEPVVVGFATGNPLPATFIPSGGYAYNLTDVATLRFLRAGEAFLVRKGGELEDEWGNVTPQPNYHWYFIHHANDVCTEEWVHPWRPRAFDGQGRITFAAEDPRLWFARDWSAGVEGMVRGASSVNVDFDIARLSSCRGRNWSIDVNYRFDGGAWIKQGVVGSVYYGAQSSTRVVYQPFISIPAGARELELYFDAYDANGCHQYDSAFGRNYRFTVN
jgi:hypothetical protein